MFKIEFKYSDKLFELEPYNTAKEKDLLLMDSFENNNKNHMLEILGLSNELILSLSEEEKIVLLYKYREISIGGDLPIKYKCRHCKFPNETELNIENLVIDSNITNDLIIDQYKKLTHDNFQDFINVDIEELDLDEYDILYKETKESVTQFDFLKWCTCLHCKERNYIDVSQYVIHHLSEDTLISLYQVYNDLIFYGKYTKQDIDTLYPFERAIFIGLLNKTREDLAK